MENESRKLYNPCDAEAAREYLTCEDVVKDHEDLVKIITHGYRTSLWVSRIFDDVLFEDEHEAKLSVMGDIILFARVTGKKTFETLASNKLAGLFDRNQPSNITISEAFIEGYLVALQIKCPNSLSTVMLLTHVKMGDIKEFILDTIEDRLDKLDKRRKAHTRAIISYYGLPKEEFREMPMKENTRSALEEIMKAIREINNP